MTTPLHIDLLKRYGGADICLKCFNHYRDHTVSANPNSTELTCPAKEKPVEKTDPIIATLNHLNNAHALNEIVVTEPLLMALTGQHPNQPLVFEVVHDPDYPGHCVAAYTTQPIRKFSHHVRAAVGCTDLPIYEIEAMCRRLQVKSGLEWISGKLENAPKFTP